MKNSKLTTMILENLPIPSQPKILIEYLEEKNAQCDINKISGIVCQDMALSTAILRTVNSVAFNLSEEVRSIQQAITLLGLPKVTNLVYCFTLRESHTNNSDQIEQFWTQSKEIAHISAYIAQKYRLLATDEAFSAAFLSNCGVPVIAEDYSTYLECYLKNVFSETQSILSFEDDEFMMDHTIVGHFLAKKWMFPNILCLAILHHHSENIEQDISKFDDPQTTPVVSKLLCVLQYADYLYTKIHDLPEPFCWKQNKEFIEQTLTNSDHQKNIEELNEQLSHIE